MRIALLAVGQRMPEWVRSGFAEYQKRLHARLPITLVEIEPGKRGNAGAEKAMEEEARRLLGAVRREDHLVLLDERGKQRTSLELSRWLGERMQAGQDLAFVIGGADGVNSEVEKRANERWSLSNLTLPHALVRVVFIEQLYRAVTLLDGHPYHRE
jgi:23S rRNA (pseudouridine1915-N3)-methyltransferase